MFFLLLTSNPILAEQQKDSAPDMQRFQTLFHKVSTNEETLISGYVRLEKSYEQLADIEKPQASQFMAMLNAMLGAYQEAENHHYKAFPASKSPGECPTFGVTVEPALNAIEKIASRDSIVMINESHSLVATRAFIIQILPLFRKMGFKYLALEALAPMSSNGHHDQTGKPHEDKNLTARGYPLDDSSTGFYLREPIYAELVREAVAAGFKLIAYEEVNAASREERESGQARTLAELIANDPESKFLVIAGYSHIWKNNGWMADRLQKETGRNVFSIDQTSRLSGCKGFPYHQPFIFITNTDNPWSSHPERVDVTIIHPERHENTRAMISGWLTLGGHRKAIQPDTTDCKDAWPCLISAIYEHENESSVPADRIILRSKNDPSTFFLKPGSYRYVVESNNDTKTIKSLVVY